MLLLHCPSICRLSILSYATFVAYPYGVYIVSVNMCTYFLYLSGFVQRAICTDVEVIADASESARSVISSQIFNGVVPSIRVALQCSTMSLIFRLLLSIVTGLGIMVKNLFGKEDRSKRGVAPVFVIHPLRSCRIASRRDKEWGCRCRCVRLERSFAAAVLLSCRVSCATA